MEMPITPTTVMGAASISKHFTAMSILLLAQRGKLSPDDDVSKYAPEWADHEHVHAGKKYLPPPIAHALEDQLSRPNLSPRELEVLKLIVKGQSNKQIAFGLTISEETVKHHVKSIISKLGVADRTEAATAAILRGTINLDR
jgi:DNA-binding NarL/FixJ family response regulator